MFQKTRYQLTIAYIGVLTIILTAFTVAVRLTFTRSLNQQLTQKLESLVKAAALNMGTEDGVLEVDKEEILVGQYQGIEWFDLQGKLLVQQGKYQLNLPLDLQQLIQVQNCSAQVCSLTKPVNDLEDGNLIGYVRVSESLIQLNSTLRRLDYGLGSGIAISLLLSTVGGIWLTRRAMQPIELSFERLQQFTADASHELRSPLMAIKTNAAVALKYPAGMREGDLEKFSAISNASNQMTQLTENLLLLARTDQTVAIATKPVNLSLLLAHLMQLYATQAQLKKLVWQEQIEQDLYLLGNETLLKQLFSNLLQNALNYSTNGGSITVKATRENSQLLVKVKDTGVGIAPEHLNKIFERFWRADPSRSYQSGKSGLGLAIVREIIRQHQGDIFVESQLGVGSCFTVRFIIAN
jgi:two-component system, OmpR family, manganese sensing sensor histidine kinase